MQQNAHQKTPRLLGGIVAVLLYAVYTSGVHTGGYNYGYPYRNHYPDDKYQSGLRHDMNRLRKQMGRQQRQLEEQVRLQQ